MTLEFLATSMIVILLPGTGVIYTLAYGLGRGIRASLFAAFGCTLGIVPHLLATIVGLAALLHTSALAFQTARAIGVAYLFYMAWGVLRDGGAFDVTEERSANSMVTVVRNGFLLNILNPKLSLFFLAFLPQFVSMESDGASMQMLLMGSVFMFLTFVVFALYGAFASLMRDLVVTRPAVLKWFRRSFAGAFGALALRLAFFDR